MGLLKLDRSHLRAGARMFAEAFQRDPMFAYLLPDEAQRRAALPVIFRGMLSMLLADGSAFTTSEQLEGIICFSGLGGGSGFRGAIHAAIGALGMPFGVLRRVSIRSMLRRARAMRSGVEEYRKLKKHYSKDVYIDLVAVTEEHRGTGVMGRLMRQVLAEADKAGKRCALDTEARANIPIYEHYGFRLVKDIEAVPGQLHFYLMERIAGGTEPEEKTNAKGERRG